MARIGSSLVSVEYSLLRARADAELQADLAAVRMATGERITSPSIDPSGFATLSKLQGDLTQARAVMKNISSASVIVGGAKDMLDAIRAQVEIVQTELEKEFDTDDPIDADGRIESQAIIDAAIEEINELAGTEIGGVRPLGGSASYDVNYDTTAIASLDVTKLSGSSLTFSGGVNTPAEQATINYTGTVADEIEFDAAFTLTGTRGETTFSVTAGQTLSEVAAEINDASYETGVTATVDTTRHQLVFTTVDYGTDASVSVTVTSGTFDTNAASDTGVDAEAVINGVAYTGDGNVFNITQDGTRMRLEFQGGHTGGFGTVTIGGEALNFKLSQDFSRTQTLSIAGAQAGRLGGVSGTLDQLASGGSLSGLGTNAAQALRVVEEALGDLDRMEGNVDGFYDAAIDSASDFYSDLTSHLEDAIEDINGVDDTVEQATINYYSGLAQNALSGMAMLYSQQSDIVNMLKSIAGLS